MIGTYCRQYFHSRRTNLTCMKPNPMWLTLICANACLLCCGASLFFLQCMIVHVIERIPLGGGCFMRLCSPAGMAAMQVFFSHRRNGGNACFMRLCSPAGMAAMHVFFSHRRNGGNACLVRLCSPVFVGEGGDRCKRSRFPRRRCVSVRKKCEWSYLFVKWALDIINDKWSNCGSDDSSCKYWRKNS